jgi:signal recognition particle subunit SEC65
MTISSRENGSNYEIRDVQSQAELLLSSVGLRIENLKGKQLVVDVGAKDCYIERSARQNGIFCVASVDISFPGYIKDMVLNKFQTDAVKLPFPDDSADLLISRGGPLYKATDEAKTLQLLSEFNRVQNQAGDLRMHPARFGFIEQQLLDNNTDFYNAKSKAPFRRSPMDIRQAAVYYLKANEMSADYLEKLGYKFEIEAIKGNPELAEDLQTFFIIKKK